MKTQAKIKLTGEQETLLVPLYCKTHECSPIITDVKAQEIVQQIAYDFTTLRIPRKTCLMLCMRAHQFDQYAREFLSEHPGCTVLHPGCGLDSRYLRLDSPSVWWYDLDMPDVIALRHQFYKESRHYKMIASSVTDLGWLGQIPARETPILILAEGLSMYLTEEGITTVVQAIVQRFVHGALIFDAFSTLTAKHAKTHPSLHQTGAKTHWGIDNPKIIEQWADSLKLQEEWYFTQSRQLDNLSWGERLPFKIANAFASARRAHRILYFTF